MNEALNLEGRLEAQAAAQAITNVLASSSITGVRDSLLATVHAKAQDASDDHDQISEEVKDEFAAIDDRFDDMDGRFDDMDG